MSSNNSNSQRRTIQDTAEINSAPEGRWVGYIVVLGLP